MESDAILQQQTVLLKLLLRLYEIQGELQPGSPYLFEDRGIYQLMCPDGRVYMLRAFQGDVEYWLAGQVAVLDYLHALSFPGPSAVSTRDGDRLARYQGWTALLLTFVEGSVADFAPETLELLAEHLAALHRRSADISKSELYSYPSRLCPTQSATQAIDNLSQALSDLPDELHVFCRDAIGTLQRMRQAYETRNMQDALLHGDCWPGNAVLSSDGLLSLIDWDTAGRGPALLDLGYLLLTCHLGKPQLPEVHADAELIAAVVRGYRRQYQLNGTEIALLADAVFYDVARRAGEERWLNELAEDWREQAKFQKMLARYWVHASIGEIARGYFSEL